MTHVTTIHMWEPSDHPREQWPVTVSVPFAAGALHEPQQVVLRDPRSGEVPAQRRPLASWPDGSIKWLLLDFATDLVPRERVDVQLEVAGDANGAEPQEGIRVERVDHELRIDTGAMQFSIAEDAGGMVRRLSAHGVEYVNAPGNVRIARPEGGDLDILDKPASVTVEEIGPQRTVIRAEGQHAGADGVAAIDYVLRYVFYAHQPILRIYHTIINREKDDPFPIADLQIIQPLAIDPQQAWGLVGTDREKYSMPEGWLRMTTEGLETHATDGDRTSSNLSTLRAEVPMEPFLLLADDQRMVTVLPRWCHFLYPKAASFSDGALRYQLWPEAAGTWEFRRGMAKTHEVVLGFAEPAEDYHAAMPAAAPILRPVIATVKPEYIQSTRSLPFFFPSKPEKYPKLETFYALLFESLSRAYGMLHYGDAPSASYTAQGRGRTEKGEAFIWVNNEYDMPYMAMHQFLRGGDRNVWQQRVEPSVWHMMDVDMCHRAPDDEPVLLGAQIHHLANHIGPPGYRADPSHEWVEGLILYHLLTGLEHPKEHALALGEHLLNWTAAHREELGDDTTAARVTGWALIALTALYEFTLDERYRQCAVEHGQAVRDRITGSTGHLTEEVSYGFPYRAGFMTDIAVIGLKRLHDITADDGWKDFALEIIDDQLEHLMLPSGLLFYKEPPENRFPLTAMFDLEVMTYAWRWTGDVRYLKHGIQLLRMLGLHDRRLEAHSAFLHEAPEGALYQEIRFFNRDSHRTHDYRFELPFLELLDELDLLKQFEPPEIDLSGIEAS